MQTGIIRRGTGFGLACRLTRTRSLELIEHVGALARQYGVRLMCRPGQGRLPIARSSAHRKWGLPAYPVFTHKHHSDSSYLACAASLLR